MLLMGPSTQVCPLGASRLGRGGCLPLKKLKKIRGRKIHCFINNRKKKRGQTQKATSGKKSKAGRDFEKREKGQGNNHRSNKRGGGKLSEGGGI